MCQQPLFELPAARSDSRSETWCDIARTRAADEGVEEQWFLTPFFSTGLYYYRARYYSPSLQGFISEDPIRFYGRDVNFYSYVRNSPVNLIDPTGLDWFRRDDQDYAAGRPGTIIPLGPEGRGRFIDDYVPAGHTFAELHDKFLDDLNVKEGTLSDLLLNIPSMPPIYLLAVDLEILRSIRDLFPPNPPPCKGRKC